MNTLIYFNALDKPDNIGISQLTDNLQQFIDERLNVFVNYAIVGNKIEFDYQHEGETKRGYALFFDVPNDFQN